MSPAKTNSYQPSLIQGLLQLPHVFEKVLSPFGKWPLLGLITMCLVASIPLITTPLEVWQQGIVAIFLTLLGWAIVWLENQRPQKQASEALHLFMAWISIVVTLRYLYYRVNYTLNLDGWVNGFFSLLLFVAELYAIGTLILSYFQTLRIRDRTPIDISTIPQQQWLKVDVYIPTYNEDVNIVRKTALAALALDYPKDKKTIYILDDGRKYPERRKQLSRMCKELGCTLLTRPNNNHAKAGNINTALKRTHGDLVLILDCDHIPAKPLLKNTVGFFSDPKVALVQTPHWFYNPDPFERNLLTRGRVPVANELFYKVIQKGNDFWNAAFFCGSAAVVRKKPLLEVGGIAVETVTEDCHTSLRLHSKKYKSIYYDKIMVAGLAPETFASYVGQQVRWARGMAQILRIENPLFNPKLKLSFAQRLCYFSATSHFFFGFPRLLYALAPVLYLLLGINLIRGIGLETLAYALPHIVLAMYANYITQKQVRFSFWNEIFEYALAFQNGIVTLMALINPKLGSFNVTDKGVSVTKRVFDWNSSRATLVMVALLVTSLLAVPFWLAINPNVTEAVLINAGWCVFNLILLVASLLVAYEQPQVRDAHRLNRELDIAIHNHGQYQDLVGKTINISETGALLSLSNWPNLPDRLTLQIWGDSDSTVCIEAKVHRVKVVKDNEVTVAVEFVDMTQEQWEMLILVIYADVNEWYSQSRPHPDNLLKSVQFVFTALSRAFREPKAAKATVVQKQVNIPTEVYWEGHFYPAIITAASSRHLKLEMPDTILHGSDYIQQNQPPVGLLIRSGNNNHAPMKLLAQLISVEASASGSAAWEDEKVTVELSFPTTLDKVQRKKIDYLLKSSSVTPEMSPKYS
ncbi:UDP-forming cellulose synthase catalytic subunit [Leptothoe sp. EHU-05/26/07-4]